jgi:acetyltransferase-like isoleucine patch superfamily enzyme
MLKRYGFFGVIRLGVSLLYTKIFVKPARLIRLPVDIRNRRNIKIGKGFTTGFGCRIEAYPQRNSDGNCLEIGTDVEINDYVHIAAGEKIVIGNNVLIASKVFISDINHGKYSGEGADSPLTPPNSRSLSTNPVIINDNVWIGESVCILPGTTIGSGCIIGALSVVTRDIPPNSIAVGAPARVVKTYDFDRKLWVSVK